jgi:hypothetical protein
MQAGKKYETNFSNRYVYDVIRITVTLFRIGDTYLKL